MNVAQTDMISRLERSSSTTSCGSSSLSVSPRVYFKDSVNFPARRSITSSATESIVRLYSSSLTAPLANDLVSTYSRFNRPRMGHLPRTLRFPLNSRTRRLAYLTTSPRSSSVLCDVQRSLTCSSREGGARESRNSSGLRNSTFANDDEDWSRGLRQRVNR